ncbi:hypothetical transcript [Echinococcus multilocularis]|uniref:Hypothetical transcript n=1 Tax=Echinococcus multilocularis TaxID=6211 RepID=A0A068Y212_ECHMU|nr:hypothetical transcript [Echinococcus multilocularis]
MLLAAAVTSISSNDAMIALSETHDYFAADAAVKTFLLHASHQLPILLCLCILICLRLLHSSNPHPQLRLVTGYSSPCPLTPITSSFMIPIVHGPLPAQFSLKKIIENVGLIYGSQLRAWSNPPVLSCRIR